MKKRVLIVIIVCLVVIGALLAWRLQLGAQRSPTKQNKAVLAPLVKNIRPVARPSQEVALTKEAAAKPATKSVTIGPIGENPFARRISVYTKDELAAQPPGTEEVRVLEPKLEGIWLSATTKVAFISGQSLSQGGQVFGWRVSQILRDRVILYKDGIVKVLKLEGNQQ
ncbi:hypothetical protein COT42_09020 [Candidatus Saganbacteria bacterium CG08_land_8_20_14_0_20_45_16]|uniref:Uncharacterized protein n=1 Tax=Candidatus Saganbacteria bacterium CG08_land_8_20_14_0_20_45_16 TaxID=2014293 RepID=A0A2H0XT58_UNCSA|nr:MAG: hypothetical protein COT42_09020 [Candidatus Saganbacteria bacterium CG08_land_8_20_14_0_20_45_16]